MTRINPIDPIYRQCRMPKRNDRHYLAWIRTLPSAHSGKTPCIAAHYRTAANSGTGVKPLFSAIPLTFMEHVDQHQMGQYNFQPREWWEEKVAHYLKKYQEEHGLQLSV